MKQISQTILATAAICITLSLQAQRDASSTAIQYLKSQAEVLQLAAGDIEEIQVTDQFTSGSITYVHLGQKFQGIPIWNSDFLVVLDQQGNVLTSNGTLERGLEEKVKIHPPVLSPEQAVSSVIQHLGLSFEGSLERVPGEQTMAHRFHAPNLAVGPILVERFIQKVGEGKLATVWNVNIQPSQGKNWWNVRVDDQTAKVLGKNDWVAQCTFDGPAGRCNDHVHIPSLDMGPSLPPAPNDYNVYAYPLESPNHGSRTIQNAPWNAALNASPYGWHDTDGNPGAEYTITRGNNVLAQDDVNGNDGSGYSPDGGPSLSFNFPIDFSQHPATYQDAAITNLFFWNNFLHDVLYQYGFDEPSGNFQDNNYGNGGVDDDYVLADAQDGYSINNAYFTTPPDGYNPRMEMFLWNSANPYLDGDLDNGIIAHEYGHGVSNRLVAGPSNTNCLFNSEQMGEGWSDILSLLFTMQPGDQGVDPRGIGTFALDEPTSGGGIRPAPYTTSLGVNGYTYGDVGSLAIPHGVGFLWCSMLWEMNWALIDQYGFDPDIYSGTGGNNICLQLILDGLKLTPCEPGFVDGRDAILLADQIHNGGANQELIWGAFAKRGLGYSASQGSPYNTSDGNEAFDVPVTTDVSINSLESPAQGEYLDCFSYSLPVTAVLRNDGLEAQSNIPVNYQFDGGPVVNEVYTATVAPGAEVTHTFSTPIVLSGLGTHSLNVWSDLPGDGITTNDQYNTTFQVVNGTGDVEEDFESSSLCSTFYDCGATDCPLSSAWRQTTNGAGDDVDWRVNEGETPSQETGPTEDHTPGTSSGNYVYLEASNGCNGAIALLTSPCLDLTGYAVPVFGFAYHMDGDHMGELHLDLFNGNEWELDIMPPLVGDQGSGWQTSNVVLSDWDDGAVMLRFRGITGTDYQSDISLDAFTISDDAVRIGINAYLEGPYNANTDLMEDNLRQGGLLPLSEPYTAMGFNGIGGGGETVDPAVLTVSGTNAIVDWVWVELRNSTNNAQVVASRAALMQRDGDIVEVDGVSPVSFSVNEGNYYVAVRHRNHLGVMGASTVLLSSSTNSLDLSTGPVATYGTEALNSDQARWLMWSGNSFNDGQIKYTGSNNDRDPVLIAIGGAVPTATASGYLVEDNNLDGTVKYTGVANDRDPILINIGGNVPTNIRVEQLP